MIKLTISIVALGIAGAVFFFYTQPTYDGIQGLQGQITQYNQALDKANELQQLKQTLLSRYNAFNPADLDRLQKLLPDHVDNVRLVLDLDNLAAHHNMALQNVVISNPSSATPGTGTIGSIGTGQQKFDSLTLKFSTRGTYDDFKAFLEDLESSLRIVDLVTLDITPDAGAIGGQPVFRYDLTIRTYWLK